MLTLLSVKHTSCHHLLDHGGGGDAHELAQPVPHRPQLLHAGRVPVRVRQHRVDLLEVLLRDNVLVCGWPNVSTG